MTGPTDAERRWMALYPELVEWFWPAEYCVTTKGHQLWMDHGYMGGINPFRMQWGIGPACPVIS